MKIKLDNVTLFGIDCIDPDKLHKAMSICMNYVDFGDVKLLTSENTRYAHSDIQPTIVEPVTTYEKFNSFGIKEKYKFVNTEFMLEVHYDGFILNPEAWTEEFFE